MPFLGHFIEKWAFLARNSVYTSGFAHFYWSLFLFRSPKGPPITLFIYFIETRLRFSGAKVI